MNLAEIRSGLKKRQESAFDAFFEQHGGALYHHCYLLALGKPAHAQELFRRAAIAFFSEPLPEKGAPEIYFLKQVHRVWLKYARFKRDLKPTVEQVNFDWARSLGRPLEALERLPIDEREILALRMVMRFTLVQITEIIGMTSVQVVNLFRQGIQRISSL